jgi:hypothetical protein
MTLLNSIDTHFLSFSYKSLTIVASLMQFLFWLSDAGPAVGSDGSLYVPTGNSTFDAATGGRDYGDSVLKLDGSTLAIKDYFTPTIRIVSARAASPSAVVGTLMFQTALYRRLED